MKKVFAIIVALALLLSACGASSAPAAGALKQEAAAMDMAMPMEAPMMEEMGYEMQDNTSNSLTTSDTGSTAIPDSRKWIITMDMSVETEDLDAMLKELDAHILEMEGYVEGQNIHNGSAYSTRRYRSANLTIRIPADSVDLFTTQVEGICNVVSSNKNLEDITLTYVSTESRMKALQTEEARLLELMEQAETMGDLLEIEARLTDVRYELESVTSRLRTYDNQVNYATIYLYIDEVQEYTPVAERTVGQRISEDFASNLKSLSEDIVDVFVWIVTSSPYLAIYAVLLTGLVFVVRKLRKPGKIKNKKEKKNTPPAEPENK